MGGSIRAVSDTVQASAAALTTRVTRVIDGDTVVVLATDGIHHKVRLAGIDAPERNQLYGRESTDYLQHRIGGGVVTVEYSKRDNLTDESYNDNIG